MISVTARETRLNERLHQLQQVLARHLKQLQTDGARQVRFTTAYDALDSFLTDVHGVLMTTDPSVQEQEMKVRVMYLLRSFLCCNHCFLMY